MKKKALFTTLTATLALAVAGPAHAQQAKKMDLYWFQGTVASAPAAAQANGTSALAVNITMRNLGAQRWFKSHANPVTFTVGAGTSYVAIVPSAAGRGNVPQTMSSTSLAVGHPIAITVLAPHNAKMREILAAPAEKVADFVNATPRTGFGYRFDGKVLANDTVNGKLTVRVTKSTKPWGTSKRNRTVVFTYDAATTFVNWQSSTPSLILPTDVKVGENFAVTVRAPRGTNLETLLAQPLWRVAHYGPLAVTTTVGT